MQWKCTTWFLLESFVVYLFARLAAANDKQLFKPGRHVCVHRKQFAQPIPIRQSYHRPMYRQTMQLCDGYRICPRYSLVYGVAYRTIFHVRISTKLVQGCCPGWTQESPKDKSCMKPVCTGGCKNGGSCTGPEKCECHEGWTGVNCDEDVNECAIENNCQQICKNLPGKYECDCHDGFALGEDKVTCKLCMSCLPEYKEMKETITHLIEKVTALEEEKDFLMGNMSYLADHYEEAMVTMHELKAATIPPPSIPTSYPMENNPYHPNPGMIPLDRIASLSEQIALLEERLEICTCNPDYDQRNRGPRH